MLPAPRMRALLNAALDSVDRISHKLYISHCGTYDVGRLHALELYCRTTSRLRVVMVCSTISLPPFLASIVLECIPLQRPSDGWAANHGCWTRLYFISFFVTFGVLIQANALVPELQLSSCRIICACVGSAFVCTAMLIGIAAAWIFPIPFTMLVGGVPFSFIIMAFFLLAVGPRRLASQSKLRRQVKCQIYIIAMETTLVCVYCLFSVLYHRLPTEEKAWFVLILPAIKLVMQHVMVWAAKDLEQFQSGIAVFGVGVFNALFMSKCMQSAGSRATYGIVIALDAVQSVLAYRRLEKTMTDLRFLADLCGRRTLLEQNMLQEVAQLSQKQGTLQQREITLKSPASSPVPTAKITPLEIASRAPPPVRDGKTEALVVTQASLLPFGDRMHNKSAMLSIVDANSCPRSTVEEVPFNSIAMIRSHDPQQDIVQAASALLFEWECHTLVEYVESVIPMSYAIYVAIVGNLSSRQYYPEILGKSSAQIEAVVLNIFAYAWIEVLSFVVSHSIVKRKSTLSPAYLLAFVIEHQAQEILGQLFIWYVILLQFTLAHFGVDFSLRFSWVHDES